MRAWLALAIVLGFATPIVADAQPAGRVDRREAVKKKIRALRAYTLTEELALDDKTAGRLFPVLARWDDLTDKLLVQRAEIQQRLAAASSVTDSKALDKLVDEAVANQKAFWDLEEKRLIELRKILTPAQTARLLVVLPTFERRIQNQIQRVLKKRRPGRAVDDEADADEPPRPPRRRR